MKRALAVLLTASLVSAPLSVLADDTAPASPEDFGQPAQPAPAGPAPAVPPLSPVDAEARPAGTVRIHFRGYKKNLDARLYQQVASDRWALVCSAPCKADVPPGTFLRATIGDGEEPHDFTVSNDLGRDLDLEVCPASRPRSGLGGAPRFGGGPGRRDRHDLHRRARAPHRHGAHRRRRER
jgi:hypothetical protein